MPKIQKVRWPSSLSISVKAQKCEETKRRGDFNNLNFNCMPKLVKRIKLSGSDWWVGIDD